MYKGLTAYLYQENTVVLDKKHIRGAKDNEFREVRLFLTDDEISEMYEELELIRDDEEVE